MEVNRGRWSARLVPAMAVGVMFGLLSCQQDESSGAVSGSGVAGEPCETHGTLASLGSVTGTDLQAWAADSGLDDFIRPALDSAVASDSTANYGLTSGMVGLDTMQSGQTALIWRSPNFHDCQDLLAVGDTTAYVTRAGVKATALTQILEDHHFTDNADLGWLLIWVERLAGADYPNLLLDRDEVCVYAGFNADGEWWAAALDCGGPSVRLSEVPSDRLMSVARLTYENRFPFDSIPPVARWEWDRANRTQAYGVKCGLAWCVTDAGGSEPMIDMAVYGSSAEQVVAGWRDEQMLADLTSEQPGMGRPSPLWAALIPDPKFQEYSDGELRTMRVRAGWAQVKGAASRYSEKFGFALAGRYEIYLVNLDTVEVVRGNIVVARRAVRYNEMGTPTIGTMRWAWSILDEEQWLPCPLGCCETEN